MSAGPEFDGLLHRERLTAFLDERLPGGGEPFGIEKLPGGASNEIFLLQRSGHRWVLRRPPAVKLSPSAHDMMREVRVLNALEGSDVPHATVCTHCDDEEVIGAPFYVMDFIDGFTVADPLPAPFDRDIAARAGLGTELVGGIAALARVDWRAAGLEDFGRPDGYLERQVQRWLGQLARYKTREIPGIDAVAAWLESNTPEMGAPALIHGDYQFVNVMFHHGAPARLAAIVDWEQSTVGDPLVDLGWMLAGWSDPGEPLPFTSYLTEREGLPTRAELAERYAKRTGREIDRLPYYMALALFKLACVMEGSYYRYIQGTSKNSAYAVLDAFVPRLIADAERVIARV